MDKKCKEFCNDESIEKCIALLQKEQLISFYALFDTLLKNRQKRIKDIESYGILMFKKIMTIVFEYFLLHFLKLLLLI